MKKALNIAKNVGLTIGGIAILIAAGFIVSHPWGY